MEVARGLRIARDNRFGVFTVVAREVRRALEVASRPADRATGRLQAGTDRWRERRTVGLNIVPAVKRAGQRTAFDPQTELNPAH